MCPVHSSVGGTVNIDQIKSNHLFCLVQKIYIIVSKEATHTLLQINYTQRGFQKDSTPLLWNGLILAGGGGRENLWGSNVLDQGGRLNFFQTLKWVGVEYFADAKCGLNSN